MSELEPVRLRRALVARKSSHVARARKQRAESAARARRRAERRGQSRTFTTS